MVPGGVNERDRDALGRPLPMGVAGYPAYDEATLPPSAALRRAQHMLDDGRPFTAHEVLEAVWKNTTGAERELWRGLAQLAVAVTHAARGNPTGAAALRARAADSLAPYAGTTPWQIPVDALREWALTGVDTPPPPLSGRDS